MKIDNSRFKILFNTKDNNSRLLENLGYKKLDKQVVDQSCKKVHLLIDTKRFEFWIVDEKAKLESEKLIFEVYRDKVNEIKFLVQ